MAKYRKKPIVVEAELYKPGLEDGFLAYATEYPEDGSSYYPTKDYEYNKSVLTAVCPVIETLEGALQITDGDYIITGIKGERYPCKPDIFAETYDVAD